MRTVRRYLLLALCTLALAGCGGVPGISQPAESASPTAAAELQPTPAPTAAVAPSASDRIVFASDRGGNEEIFAMNADGSGLARLTDHPARDYDPDWAPNRRQIAFVSERTGTPEIYLVAPDGDGLRRLTDKSGGATEPAWSPDGSQIAYVATRGDKRVLAVVMVESEETRTLFSNPPRIGAPAWSPDGTHIAFSAAEPSASNNREI